MTVREGRLYARMGDPTATRPGKNRTNRTATSFASILSTARGSSSGKRLRQRSIPKRFSKALPW